jgi:hypothetical protein
MTPDSAEEESSHEAIQQNVSPEEIINALTSEETVKIYANGFINVHSSSDVSIVLQQHGKPVGVVNMSYTLAKTLVQQLGDLIIDLEEELGQEFPTTGDVEERRKSNQKKEV